MTRQSSVINSLVQQRRSQNGTYNVIGDLTKFVKNDIKKPNYNDYTGYKEDSLKCFLENVEYYGFQIANNFKATFSGCHPAGIEFYVSSIELPSSKQTTCDIYYDGIKMVIPVNYIHDNDFSMTVNNDANGYLYTAFKTYIELDSYNHFTDSGQTLLIRSLTGQTAKKKTIAAYRGAVILCKGVRFTSISGLSFGQSNNEIQQFTLNGTMIEYVHLPTYIYNKLKTKI